MIWTQRRDTGPPGLRRSLGGSDALTDPVALELRKGADDRQEEPGVECKRSETAGGPVSSAVPPRWVARMAPPRFPPVGGPYCAGAGADVATLGTGGATAS